ncbi:MAG: tetratricopeptide repeat protein [Magnetococcales bacterium]|nr:tetratricopeptide repeat protein [Magnetococcales bacterium]
MSIPAQDDQVLWMRGIEFHQRGELDEAERCYRRIDPHHPGYIYVLANLGLLLDARGEYDAAESSFLRALALDPTHYSTLVNYSNTLIAIGRLHEAESLCRRGIAANPDGMEAHCALGNVQSTVGRLAEAEIAYGQALAIRPDFVEALVGLGNVMTRLGRHDEAVPCYRRALAIRPGMASAMGNLGLVLTTLGQLEEARSTLQAAIALDPGNPCHRLNLGLCLGALNRPDQAEAVYREALVIHSDNLDIRSNLLFLHNYREDGDLTVSLADARQYGELVAAKATPFVHHPEHDARLRRLRVGLVSGDLLNHPVGFFLDGVIPWLVQETLDLYVYSNCDREDDLTGRLRASIPMWRSVLGMSDATLARRIHADGIDILMDLSGHTARNRLPLFAWKPAPIQATWLGFFATTGLASMDYILGDPYNLPPEEAGHFVETPWPLPQCYLAFTPPDLAIGVNDLPAARNGFVTFGSCNKINKINDGVIACWAQLLQAVPTSRLLIKNQSLADPLVRQEMLLRFLRHGIPTERILLEGPSTRERYFEVYHRIDIALDPFPYPGVTTSVEGLWMGVPFITRKGKRYLSHQGESILANAGLADWIAGDVEAYVAKAVHFASRLGELAALRRELRPRVLRSPLFDTRGFAGHLARAWREMWHAWCSQGRI